MKRKKLKLSSETIWFLGDSGTRMAAGGTTTPATYCCIMTGPSMDCDTSYEQCYETVYTTPSCTC